MLDRPTPQRSAIAPLLVVLATICATLGLAVPALAAGGPAFHDGSLARDASAAAAATPATPKAEVSATPRIVGGTVLKSNASAPYTVAIQTQFDATTFAGCSGTVLDALHVLTAAHCFVNKGVTALAANVRLGVGYHDIATKAGQAATTVVGASGIRIHPLYDGVKFSDDVAVVTLAAPLDLTTGRIAALPMAPIGTYLKSGAAVRVTGYGISDSSKSDFGTLRSVRTEAQTAGLCGTDSPAVMLCTFRKGHAACEGDSGGTASVDSGKLLIGVTDIAVQDCAKGLNLYANVASPEIRAFIDAAVAEQTLTAAQIGVAPRGGLSIKVTGTAKVGRTITCRRGAWSGSPKFRYAFVRVKGNREQDQELGGKRTYRLRSSDRDWTFGCAVEASNPAGTGVSVSRTLRTVR